jgi:hypothetical protein
LGPVAPVAPGVPGKPSFYLVAYCQSNLDFLHFILSWKHSVSDAIPGSGIKESVEVSFVLEKLHKFFQIHHFCLTLFWFFESQGWGYCPDIDRDASWDFM